MRFIKRVVDLTLSCAFLILGWPIFLIVSIAIKLDSRGPILFRQERVGERGESSRSSSFERW
jgi:O-antigen biosynthesis protein WbqP